jgi:hypothetical protein
MRMTKPGVIVAVMLAVVGLGKPVNADLSTQKSDPRVAEFMTHWLGAQNDGDFAAYERLYARDFEGVRRSGSRTVHLDRTGWMKDRGRMFKKPMHVDADETSVMARGAATVVMFMQTWRSGNYHDVGRKRLELVSEDNALRIRREELLESRMQTTAPAVANDGPKPITDQALCLGQVDNGEYAHSYTLKAKQEGNEIVLVVQSDVAVLAICRDGRLTARLDDLQVEDQQEWQAIEAYFGEVRPGVQAFAIRGNLVGRTHSCDTPSFSLEPGDICDGGGDSEGAEENECSTYWQLFALVGGRIVFLYDDTTAHWMEPPQCAGRGGPYWRCEVMRPASASPSASGWYDLERRCEEYSVTRHRLRRKVTTTRLRFKDGAYQ